MAKKHIRIRKKKRGAARGKKKLFPKILAAALILLTAAFGVLWLSLPNIGAYTYSPQSKTEVYSADGVLIGEIASRKITFVSREDIPDRLVYAVVAIEDKRFFSHCGVDVFSIVRALYHNILAGEIVEGGSTITQQVAKILFFNSEQSYLRKLREALTALRLNKKYSKDEIITIYLNEIYFGGGAFGIYEAAETYFSKTPRELTLDECAMLAGIIQAPSAYCPLDDEGYTYAMQRRDKVLNAMLAAGYITDEEAAAAKAKQTLIEPTYESTFEHGTAEEGCGAFLNRVYEEALAALTTYYQRTLRLSAAAAAEEAEASLYGHNMTITTTLSCVMQQKALAAIEENIGDKASCAYVSINSDDGSVLCYYGADRDTYIDMADSPRQPGSNIKPLYMLYLCDAGIADRNTVVLDERFHIGDYSPGNYSGKYMGYVTMREALTFSLNSACLRFFTMTDYRSEIDFVKSLGITTVSDDDYNYAFALGGLSYGIKPIEMACAYGVINNGGLLVSPKFVVSLTDENGTVIFPEDKGAEKIVSAESAAQIYSCLKSVVLRGTATAANSYYATAGKTGTTDNSRDVWFTGATGNVVTSIWAGNVDYEQVEGLSSSWCVRTYSDSIIAAVKDNTFAGSGVQDSPAENTLEMTVLINSEADIYDIQPQDAATITVPDYEAEYFAERSVVSAVIDSSTGLLFSERCPEEYRQEKYFLTSQAPTQYCTGRHKNNNNGKDDSGSFWEDLWDMFRK